MWGTHLVPACAPTGYAGERPGYRHESFFYRGEDEFVSSTAGFVREGVETGEHAVVAVVPERARLLRGALGDDTADRVTFIDMLECGRNPARIIQVWRDLVEAAELRGACVRGVGEPIWAGRTEAELLEAELHEALLNEAFGPGDPLLLRCPYDVSALDPQVVETARVTHPETVDARGRAVSEAYAPEAVVASAFHDPLPEPTAVEEDVVYCAPDLVWLRRLVAAAAARHGMAAEAADALVLAMREIAANSIRHAGGAGRLRLWVDDGALVCELSDSGHITDPMVGRLRPAPESESGRGVWLANQLSDLVQLRSSPSGTVVRLHVALRPANARRV